MNFDFTVYSAGRMGCLFLFFRSFVFSIFFGRLLDPPLYIIQIKVYNLRESFQIRPLPEIVTISSENYTKGNKIFQVIQHPPRIRTQ